MDKATAQRKQLEKAFAFLKKALNEPESDIQRAATIQAFEFCFELSWKYLKSLLEEDGAALLASPKSVFREAAKHGFIDNPEQWFTYLQARNLTVHTYVETVADQVYAVVESEFATALETLLKRV